MKLFITGIGTDVGKTIASAIVVEALQADYWKPIQAGDLDTSDTHKIKQYISNPVTAFHPNSYALNTPASPHFAAEKDGIIIQLEQILEPVTENHLVIEGAGGILVPLNNEATIIDLIQPDYKVIVVSRHYLGSINHTLLTIEALQNRKIPIAGIIFNGDENEATEAIILSKTQLTYLGRIENEPYFDTNVIRYYADKFKESLINIK
ncbi:MAG: dethiobiotin synthase [Flavobacterium sp.]|uniref:dethiobiotin synthase n=1 Tax=Flavobacterium sp. TaxID=239 RepID=UPI000C610535|nr:dethiobiotin synthase [Flavobacterium sp.]MBF03371.1 dethiobiotin synthase [Flavobacterium sp.]|tara:strand:+ start:8288 stop:8908 length:621 start_codon:yes stop_codon:yes gene_type:complete